MSIPIDLGDTLPALAGWTIRGVSTSVSSTVLVSISCPVTDTILLEPLLWSIACGGTANVRIASMTIEQGAQILDLILTTTGGPSNPRSFHLNLMF